MKKIILSTLLVLQVFLGFAQTTTGISGKVLDAKTQKPIQNVIATIQNTSFTQVTNAAGEFKFTGLPVGSQLLLIKSDGYKEQLMPIEILANQMLDLGVVVLENNIQEVEQQASLISITETDLGDDNSGSESTSGLLQATRDAFQQSAAFNWGQARFRVRGLDNEYGTIMINGITMNKIYDGRPQFSNWGGLNDATRNQEFTMCSAPSDYSFGGALGTQEINTRASSYRPGNRISFSGTNTNYKYRIMGTMSSGMRKDGWAYTISAGRRWAEEAYFEGTNYSANSFFASVEKKINDKHSLNFTTIFAQNSRAKNGPNTDEVTELAGEKYNSYWGFQDGKKRNSRVKNAEEPILMLSHFWKVTDKTNINTNIAYQFGQIGNSRIDYIGAGNPDPTYYRNLPSYFTSKYNPDTNAFEGNSTENIRLAGLQKDIFLNNKQLDWNGLIYANQHSGDGHSFYALYEDRTDDKLLSANTIINSQIADNITFNGGVNFKKLKSENFQNMLDLLGGDYLLDTDTFGGTINQQQSDLNNPLRKVVVGDRYGYNYNMLATTLDAFTQFRFTYKSADFYLAQTYARSEYQREGLYKNGYYPTNSFGKSDKAVFDNFGFKGGLTIKASGRHLFNFNGLYETKAPSMKNTFPNARVNNNIIKNIKSEVVSSADASYIIRTPKLKTRITAYYSKIKDATESSFFFADGFDDGDPTTDATLGAFVAETLTGLDKKNIGGELGIEYNLTSTIKLSASAAYGESTFDSNPNIIYNLDASGTVLDFGKANLKGYKQSGAPQQAASFGIEYRDPKFWYIGANANYLANNYLDIATITRTERFFIDPLFGANNVPFSEATQERAKELLKQEKFDPIQLLNLTGGKSWRVSGKTIGFFASINNVLDFKYKTGGYEQARDSNFRQLNQDVSSKTPSFAPKYFYGNGRTYFVNLYINF